VRREKTGRFSSVLSFSGDRAGVLLTCELEDGEFLFRTGDFPFLRLLVIALGETQWFSGNASGRLDS
jgi:hypothetical protein